MKADEVDCNWVYMVPGDGTRAITVRRTTTGPSAEAEMMNQLSELMGVGGTKRALPDLGDGGQATTRTAPLMGTTHAVSFTSGNAFIKVGGDGHAGHAGQRADRPLLHARSGGGARPLGPAVTRHRLNSPAPHAAYTLAPRYDSPVVHHFAHPLGGPEAHAQSAGTITGRVIEAGTGAPLPGANVIIEDLGRGISTDREGRFRFARVPSGDHTLVVTFVGYERAETTVTVEAGATATANITLESRVLETGEVIVTGLREGQLRAIRQKRQAANVVDVLSADAIGKLPDQNVAEAVQRIPGIAIQTDRGEGRFVSIRGTEPSLNNVTVNGQSLAYSFFDDAFEVQAQVRNLTNEAEQFYQNIQSRELANIETGRTYSLGISASF